MKFSTTKLNDLLLKNIEELEFTDMTPIQELGIPLVLEGKDIIAEAKTGSGKTAVFSLNILNKIEQASLEVQAMILCPTRELAEQVAKETRMFARKMANIKIQTLCGGVSEYHQEKSLDHGVHIIVGTPGRVLSLLQKKALDLSKVKTFVLDEADRMLDMGFINAINDIELYIPGNRQTLLFSATFPDEITSLSKDLQIDAQFIKASEMETKNNITEYFFKVEDHKSKNIALLKILGEFKPDRVIVFCKTKHITTSIAKFLNKNGICAEAINGDLLQNQRTAVLSKFSNKSLNILVATDVAARGLDISSLAAVINFDLSRDPEVYVHRIGRTGRAGESGLSFSFITEDDLDTVDLIEEYTNQEINLRDIEEVSDAKEYDLLPEMKTIYISGGKKNKLRPGDIVGAIVGEAKVDHSLIGEINIMNIMTYVAVKNEVVEEVITKLNLGKIKNRKFKVGLA